MSICQLASFSPWCSLKETPHLKAYLITFKVDCVRDGDGIKQTATFPLENNNNDPDVILCSSGLFPGGKAFYLSGPQYRNSIVKLGI